MDIFKSRKGNAISDALTIAIFLMLFGIISVFFYMTLYQQNTDIQATFTDADAAASVQTMTDKYPSIFDGILLLGLVGLTLGAVVSAFLIDSHPIFFIFNVFLLTLVFFVMVILGNSFNDIMTDSTIVTYAASFPYMTWVMSHILTIGIAVGFLILIALFTKLR